jgi:hypothetical protein
MAVAETESSTQLAAWRGDIIKRQEQIEQELLEIEADLDSDAMNISDLEKRKDDINRKIDDLQTALSEIEEIDVVSTPKELMLLKRRFKRREEKRRKLMAEQYPFGAALFLPFVVPPKKPGRPPRTEQETERNTGLAQVKLIRAMREIRSSLMSSTVRRFDIQIAKTLLREAKLNPNVSALLRKPNGELVNEGYLRGLVGGLISFAKTKLGPAPPGREDRSLRNRAIDLILWYEAEQAPYGPPKLKK